jgi:iron complex outermembrane receptor protein
MAPHDHGCPGEERQRREETAMNSRASLQVLVGASRIALGAALFVTASAAFAQAPEDQTQTDPAPAEDAAGQAAAQTDDPGVGNAPTADEGGVEEIVVTAQFREQNLQDTPLAITAVSGAMMEARSQTNIAQVAAQAPSVTLKPQGAAFGPSLGANIRGAGQFDFNPALEPAVGLYIDDVYYATLTGSIFDLLDLERVEILRGPQGTLAGRNSIGGAVKLYSKRPQGDNSGYVQGTYGSRDRIDLRAGIDFNLLDGVDARLAGVSKKQGGYVKRLDFGCVHPAGVSPLNPANGIPPLAASDDECLIEKDGEIDYQAARGQLRIRPHPDIEINIIGDYTHDDRTVAGGVLLDRPFPNGVRASPAFPVPTNPPYNVFPPSTNDINPFPVPIPYDTRFVCGKFCNYATFQSLADGTRPTLVQDGRTKFNSWGVSGQVEWDLTDNLQLVSITAYRDYYVRFSNDDDSSPLAHSLGGGNLTFWSFSQEVRLNGSFLDDRLEFTLGGFYIDQRSVYATTQDLRYAGLQPFRGNDPVNVDSKAVFAHVAFRPFDPLTITGGIRYTEEHKDYTYSRRQLNGAVAPPPLGPLDGLTGVFDGDRVDYRINAQYEVTNDISVYAQFSTGFKGGGVNPRPFFPQQVLGFGPEVLETYELGLKTDPFDRMARVNLAAFYSDYKGIQLTLSNCTAQAGPGFGIPCALPFNAGDAKVKGFEFETSIRPVDGLLIDGALSYIDFEYKDIDPNAGGPNRINGPQFGDYPIYTPEWKWAIGVQYEFELGTAGSLTPRIDAAYQSEIFTNAANRPTNRIAPYTLANARLTWANVDKDLEVSAEVTNLFDKYYLLTVFDLTLAGAGFSSGQPGRPREWAITVKKKF